MMRRVLAVGMPLVAIASACGLGACGDRTGLFVDETPQRPDRDASVKDVVPDFTLPDVVFPADAAPDVTIDALPPIDVAPRPDVVVTDCPDAAATLVYVVTVQNELFSFYPPTGTFKEIGLLACPAPPGWTPFSMAVDRKGTAYVLFSMNSSQSGPPGMLFQVSTATAACVATPYQGGQSGFDWFGMGFVGNPDGRTDTLYVASDTSNTTMMTAQLATIDTASFLLNVVGTFTPQPVMSAELSGTGDGRLFAFYAINNSTSSAVAQIDPASANVIANNDLANLPQNNDWAFAFWGGDFYLFTASSSQPSTVTRFRPSDGSQVTVGSAPDTIVGAGVSTCAPQQ